MSRILRVESLLPSPETPVTEINVSGMGLNVSPLRALEFDERQAELPDRRAFRTMSRAAMMLSVLGMRVRDTLAADLERDSYRVGVYFACENGPVDMEAAAQMKDFTPESFAADYKRLRTPTMYLKQLPNLAAGHFCIFLGIRGPYAVFTDSQNGALHALEQAELDLNSRLIDKAVVGASFSFETPLAVARNQRLFAGDRVVSEGAALLILEKSNEVTDWTAQGTGPSDDYFGIAGPIIGLSKRGEQYASRTGAFLAR